MHPNAYKRCALTVFATGVPGEIKSREVELDPQPRRDHEQGGGDGPRKLDFFRFSTAVQRTLSL